jgi:hypothetical protein
VAACFTASPTLGNKAALAVLWTICKSRDKMVFDRAALLPAIASLVGEHATLWTPVALHGSLTRNLSCLGAVMFVM